MSVQDKVTEVLADLSGVDKEKILAESRFDSGLAVGPLMMFELITTLEDEFSLKIPNEDAERLEDVGSMVAYIESRM
jgi:acyl carrier protein